MTSTQFSGFWNPSPPVYILARSIVLNPRNLPYYVCILLTPLPPSVKTSFKYGPQEGGNRARVMRVSGLVCSRAIEGEKGRKEGRKKQEGGRKRRGQCCCNMHFLLTQHFSRWSADRKWRGYGGMHKCCLLNFWEFLTPSLPLVSTKSTQTPFLSSEIGQPPPSPSLLTSFVNGPE